MLNLTVAPSTPSSLIAQHRANAVFIYSKLVAGGMSQELAKNSVELLWHAALDEGAALQNAKLDLSKDKLEYFRNY